MTVVLDTSATLAWIYSDETTPAINALFDGVTNGGAIVPCPWRLEVANSLHVAVRRGRVTSAFRNGVLAGLTVLAITVDPDTGLTFTHILNSARD